jgi:hypothetical protein
VKLHALLVGFALLAHVACDRAPEEPAEPVPVAPRAGAVIEPPDLRIGDVAVVDVAVVVPPGHRVQPLPAPERVPGLWILEAEELPVERGPSHHVHRTRFKVRARETGEFTWPAQVAVVETPTGERLEVESMERPVRIHEVTGDFAGRREPFSFRAPPEARRDQGFALPALLGAGGTALALALLALVRRVRRRPLAPPVRAPHETSWRATQAALEAALERIGADPVAAADAASAAIRVYVSRRYGAVAETATTEELAAREPPLGAGSRWPELLRLLRALDAFRFRSGASGDPLECRELAATLRAAQRFVSEAAPHGYPN